MEQLSLSENVVYQCGINEKQDEFFEEVLKTTVGKSPYRYFFYGGAIRGGKTAVCLTLFILLAKKYPNSRWHIIRDSFTTLEATTIPSIEKFCPVSSESVKKYNRDKGNYYVEFKNGSKIFIASEKYDSDPELTWMLGLETNGIMLEQIEGLQQKTFNKALERLGSWYINPMPPPIILATMNPSHTWSKEMIYNPFKEGNLREPFYFVEALPTDNPLVTQEQWKVWKNLDPVAYARFIEGDWDVVEAGNLFMNHYSSDKHESEKAVHQRDKQLLIIIDFNVNPFSVNFAHRWTDKDGEHAHIFDEAAIMNGSIPALCDLIIQRYRFWLPTCEVTGDYTGTKKSIEQKDNASYYIQLQRLLGLKENQLRLVPNPTHENSRADCNYVLYHYPDFKINPKTCPKTCRDMKIVQCDSNGSIIKENRKKVSQLSDFLDNSRYFINVYLKDWINRHGKNYHLKS